MTRCEHCLPLILDHLYGLLDGPDELEVDAHLLECPSCAAARAEAARLQGMIARAARAEFPRVRFEAPAATPAQTPAPLQAARSARLPVGRGSARMATWLPWAVAAAVLIAVPSTVFPVLGILDRASAARKSAENSMTALADKLGDVDQARQAIDEPRVAARRELAARSQTLDAVLARWVAAEKDGLAQARKTSVDVLKPASLQPGAPNELQLFVRDGGITPQNLVAEIREVRGGPGGRTDAVILSTTLNPQSVNAQPLRLPTDVWSRITPQSELFLVVKSTDGLTGAQTEVQERVRLFGPVFATMLVTDKPSYRPGETLYFRSLTLDRATFRPPQHEQVFDYELYHQTNGKRSGLPVAALEGGSDLVLIANGKVEPILAGGKPIRGVGCGAFALPEDLADGDYVLSLREQMVAGGYPPSIPIPVERTIKVRSGLADDYRKQTQFSAASYRPGDTVEAWADLFFQEKPVAGAEAHAIVTADNLTIYPVQLQPATDPRGRVKLRFALPKELERGDVRLKVEFRTDRGVETVAERVPVVGRNVVVEFFPEGGKLVAGVPCRVYFRATAPTGEPVDIKGVITNGRQVLSRVETLTGGEPGANRGMGSFTFTPALGTLAWLKLETPAGMQAPLLVPPPRDFPSIAAAVTGTPAIVGTQTGFSLPRVEPEGVVMTVLDPISSPGQPIRVHLHSVGTPRTLVVGAYTRGRLSDSQRVIAEVGHPTEVRLMANKDPRGGVVRITVFEETENAGGPADPKKPALIPVAERLVFRKPGELLNLSFSAHAARSAGGALDPGSPVELSIAAQDEKGNPAAAILYAAAVNTGVARGARDRLLTTHFLLAGEITTPDAMEYADFLLTDQPKAGEVLDLVLATQGWRQFAEQTPAGFIKKLEAPNWDRTNLLVSNGQNSVVTEPAEVRTQHKHFETYWPQYVTAKKSREDAQAALAAANADHAAEERARELTGLAETARLDARTASDSLNKATEPVARFQKAGWYGVAGFGVLALLLGSACLVRPKVRLPLGIGTSGALGLVAFLIFSLGMAEKSQASIEVVGDTAQLVAPAPAPSAVTEPETGLLKSTNGLERLNVDQTDTAVAPPGGSRPDQYKFKSSLMPKGGSQVHKMPGPGGIGGGGMGGRGPAAPVAPTVTAGGGAALGFGAETASRDRMALRRGKPQITDDDILRRYIVTEEKQNHWQVTRPISPPSSAQPTALGAIADLKPKSESALQADARTAKEFAEARAQAATTLLRESFARKQATSVAEVKRAMEEKKRGNGWTKTDGTEPPPPPLSPADAAAISNIELAIPRVPPLTVREYAARRPGPNGDADSADTVLWQPLIVLPEDGKTKLGFHLGAAPGGCQVIIAGHTLDGRIGAVRRVIPVAPLESNPPAALPGTPAPVPPPAP